MKEQQMPDFIFEVESHDTAQTEHSKKPSFDFADSKFISRILRSVGAIIIVVSASSFLFQHWTPGSDLQRFLLLLGFTSVLSLSGLFCGLRLKESKGARTLLGLTLAVTPVNFAIIGALLFSQFSWDSGFANLPNYATWVASSPSMALLTATGGVALLIPLVHFSFMTLGHKQAKLLTLGFSLSNLTLLLPTRQPNIIAGVFVLLVALLLYNELHRFRRETSLNTFEGRVSRGMLWVPALILVGRGCYFYTPSQLFISAILIASALLSFFFLPQLTEKSGWQKLQQLCGAVLASAAWINLAELLGRSWHLADQWALPLISLPIAGLLMQLARFAVGDGSNYRRAAVIIAILGAVGNLLLFPGIATSLACLLISASALVYGYLIEQKIIFFSGTLGTLLGIGYQLKNALYHFSLSGWSSLMVIGVVSIIVASLLERNNGKLREKTLQIRNSLRRWGN